MGKSLMSQMCNDFRGHGRLIVLGAVFCVVIGFTGSVGPRWISHRLADSTTENRDEIRSPGPRVGAQNSMPLPPDPFLSWLIKRSKPQQDDIDSGKVKMAVESIEMRLLESIRTAQIQKSIPSRLESILAPERAPLTSRAIRDTIGTLPLPDRLECWAYIIANANAAEFPAVFHRVAREPFPESISQLLMNCVAAKWARLDPQSAFDAFRVPYPTMNGRYWGGLSLVAIEWLKSDPAAVLEQVENLAFEYQRNELLSALLPRMSDRVDALTRARNAGIMEHLPMAVEFAQSQPWKLLAARKLDEGIVPDELMALAIGAIAKDDPDAALDQAGDLLKDQSDNSYLNWITALAIADGWGLHSPQEALVWSRQWRSTKNAEVSSRDPGEVEAQVIRRWIESDPSAAAPEVMVHSHYQRRMELIRLLGKSWREKDAIAAREWIESVPVGKSQEESLIGYLQLDANQANEMILSYKEHLANDSDEGAQSR